MEPTSTNDLDFEGMPVLVPVPVEEHESLLHPHNGEEKDKSPVKELEGEVENVGDENETEERSSQFKVVVEVRVPYTTVSPCNLFS